MHRVVLVFALFSAVAACSGPAAKIQVQPDGGQTGSSAVAWPVTGATVTAFHLNPATLVPDIELGTATTAVDGSFALALTRPVADPVLVVVSGGSYTEPATGTPILLTGHQLTAIRAPRQLNAGAILDGAVISPISHLAAQLALHLVAQGAKGTDALAKATSLLNAHFGALDWSAVRPADLTDPNGGKVQLNDQTKAGLILGALSQEARTLAEARGFTPGAALNSYTLLDALAHDLGDDGFFDGRGAGGQLVVPAATANAYSLDGQTVRSTLAQGILAFLANPRNTSKLTQTDVAALVAAIAADSDPQLYRDGGGPVNVTPPTIAWVQPASAGSVRGSTAVEVTATAAAGKMSSFAFAAPDGLKNVVANSESNGTVRRLRSTLDVSALADGPLALVVTAADEAGNVATNTLTVTVANHGPSISPLSPGSNTTVKGTVTIAASAAPQQSGTTIHSLALLNPPPGAGPNSSPAADQLNISWDTTKALEGPYTLQLQATDSAGGQTTVAIPLTVDNVPFGVLHLAVSFGGQPIANAIAHVFAVRDADAQVDTTIGIGGEMGPACATDRNGLCTIILSTENRTGPIHLVAGGTGISFVDTADGTTRITVPQDFQFTSFIGNYATGAAITAPITDYTSLADVAAAAYAHGQHRLHPVPHSLSASLSFTDPLFNAHVTSAAWDLRSTLPVSLTAGSTESLAVSYASLPGIGLSQAARELGAAAGSSVAGFNGLSLLQLLEDDASADGQLDGLGHGGARLVTAGTLPQQLDSNTFRFTYAKSLDDWFPTSANKSGIDEPALLGSGILQTISNDTSDLFGSSPAPLPFDNQPPVVSFSATTFHGPDGQDHAPFGGTFIAGRLNLVVNVSDTPAGVRSVSVTMNGSPLASGAGSSLPRKFVAAVDTTKLSDGALAIAVTAVDNYGNAGTSSITYKVDNTPPSPMVSAPVDQSPANGNVAVAATATDAGSGLASFVLTGLAGFQDIDTSVAGIAGTWSSTSTAEGNAVGTFTACDNVGNCGAVTRTVIVDRTPPTVNVTSPVGIVYQKALSIGINATASDAPTGVVAVCARLASGAASEVCGSQNGGVWSIPFTGLALNNTNAIAVYAKDGAGNSGFGSGVPGAQQTVTVLVDQLNPQPTLESAQAPSYFDERGMQLVQTGADPRIRGSWTFDPSTSRNSNGRQLLQVDTTAAQTPLHKTVQRLALGTSTPALSDLLNASGSSTNTPYLSFVVPYNANTDAPITGASYSATISCPGCLFAAATGQLIRDTTTAPRFILPIALEFIPGLGQIPNSAVATITVSVSATDAAGNTGTITTPASFAFALDAPPFVAVVNDANYANEGDPWAVNNCRLSNGTYTNCFAAATASTPAEGERAAKYVIYNPGASYGLAVQVVNDTADTAHSTPVIETIETWNDEPLSAPFAFGSWCTACGGGNTCGVYAHFYWRTGSSSQHCPSVTVSNDPSTPYPPTKQTSAPLQFHVYRLSTDGTAVAGDASVAGNNAYVIPAASSGYMGMAVVFVGRTAASVTRFPILGAPEAGPITWNGSALESPYAYVTQPPSTVDRSNCDPGKTSSCYANVASWIKRLDAAQTSLSGALNYIGNQFAIGTTNPVGASTPAIVTPFTRTIGH